MKNQEKPIIISAWICAGKTHLVKKNKRATELPSGDYKYILTDEQKAVENKESLKSTKREINPLWPSNYYDAILKTANEGKYDIILIAPCMPFEEMRNYGIDFLLAYPDPICKEDYKERARQRGVNEEFVKRVETNIQTDFEEFLKQPNEKIILQPDEYLEDALIRVGILK
ncbi:MAG: hypothetical protein LBM09_00170 [Candidatus Nomurabacteria bacterium]|jgi:hypothetical protein|nr:hypothetical protein [Candidatus Nomurabacteria bacterium]